VTQESRAHLFFVEHVEPNLRDWEASPLEPQRAMNIAVALNQLADHYWHCFCGNPKNVLGAGDLTAFRRALSVSYPSFSLIRDVADAHKHFRLSRSDRNISEASQATVGSMGWGEAEFGVGEWGSPPEVVVTYDDGTKHHFRAAVWDIVEMWRGLLANAA
jgi:hypothetical protein